MLNAAVLLAGTAMAAFLLTPRVAKGRLWRATTTPLASIIGSGFLVLGPILSVLYGALAPLVMAILCSISYLFGNAIRYNIRVIDGPDPRPAVVERMETIASAILAFAYIISVTYYLNLFGAFGVRLTPLDDSYHARLLASAMLLLILMVGWTRGFSALERLEQVSVGIKLAVIAALTLGLAVYFCQKTNESALLLNPVAISGWPAIATIFGLIITVQGFETSRYLGRTYDAHVRVRSMRLAQHIATGIYMFYILLLAYVFPPGTLKLDETAIVNLMEIVAPILPGLLVVAALSAQFSAAVADTTGSGGLIAELSGGRISPRHGYGALVGIGLFLTWNANVFQIISYASRAFAAYYGMQAIIAAVSAGQRGDLQRSIIYGAAAVMGLAITIFGIPVE